MLISLNWIRDFIDLPAGLDPRDLAERFTRTTAEVDSVETLPRHPHDQQPHDDWIIEIDNKSLTNRPDLWGHYGIAREIAAILELPLKPYPVTPIAELTVASLPEVPIKIADPDACPRYSAIVLEGVPTQPAPQWMQLRLSHVGQRPISGLVDLTNYVMCELGQPMHAFDAAKISRIEVDGAKEGERFRTLDGVERTLTPRDLMIQCAGRSIALAGVMGGLDTEVSSATTKLLLESANFNGAIIRRTATRLSLRTDASARFEKSLDPANTVLGIQRFVCLARSIYPNLKLAGRLSDAYPKPPKPVTVHCYPANIARYIGRDVPQDEIHRLLTPLGFQVKPHHDHYDVAVPSHRATGDVSIEADVIEEIARCIGYHNIAPQLPRATVRRFPLNALHELENRTIEHFTAACGFHEINDYIWFEAAWLKKLGVEPGPCVELSNPAGEGLHQLRRTLIPGMLAAVVKNRFFLPAFSLVEIGSIFEPAKPEDGEYRHVGLVVAQRGKGVENNLYARLKGSIETWGWIRFGRRVTFARTAADPPKPWEHPQRTAAVIIECRDLGRISVIDVALRRAMDEHLGAWSVCWAELRLSGLESLEPMTESLDRIPEFPLVELDFSLLVARSHRFDAVVGKLNAFAHPHLRRMAYVSSYEGDAIDKQQRSLTFRTVLGHPQRTLTDGDVNDFRTAFESHVTHCGYGIRK